MTKRIVLCCALIALVFIGFWPALDGEFLGWDDDRNFLTNTHYRGLSLTHLEWMFTTFHMGPYQPLSWLTLGVDHALWGMDPRGYHLTNAVLHAAAAILFFFLARRLFVSARPAWTNARVDLCAFLAAVLFAVHPLRVESVAWITERRDVLSGVFFLATVLAWLSYTSANDKRYRRYVLALFFFACALLSKASVVTLPFALIVLDHWPLARWRANVRSVLIEKVPLIVLSVAFAVVAIVGQSATGTAMRAFADHGLVKRTAQASYAVLFQPWKTLLPTGLSPIYDMPSPFVPWTGRFVAAFAFAVVVTSIAWIARKRWPAFSAGWFAFLVLLAPVSGLVSVGPQLVADRYTYLACMPFALMLAGGVGLLAANPGARVASIVSVSIACLALTAATYAQSTHWRTSIALWERAYAVDPDSAVACDHLGVMRVMQSHAPDLDTAERMRLLSDAIGLYTRAYETDPHPNQVFNIGGAVAQRAPLDPATRVQELELAAETMQMGIEFAERTTGVDPRWRTMYASVLVELKRYDAAREHLASVLDAQPNHVGALQWSARIAIEEGRPEEGLALLRRTTEIDPENEQLWNVLANTCESLGFVEQAATAREAGRKARQRSGK